MRTDRNHILDAAEIIQAAFKAVEKAPLCPECRDKPQQATN
jgi:hypothetical protein